MSAPILPGELSLADLEEGRQAEIERLDLPEEAAHRLMALGFLPGAHVRAGRCAPAGDPRIYQVDGAEIALRRETAACVKLRCPPADHAL